MKPLLAHVYEPHRITFPCWVQPKLNGIRALYQDGHFQSRDELPWQDGILNHIAEELRCLELNPSVILDGELYVHGWPLQRINGAVTPVRNNVSNDTSRVEYHIFDKVAFRESFEERWSSLPHGLQLNRVSFVESKLIFSLDEGNSFYKEKVDEGYEGIMYRLGDCPYTKPKQHWAQEGPFWNVSKPRSNYLSDKDNRTFHLLKRKSWLDSEFPCTDFTLTTGADGFPGFQLTCRAPKGKLFNLGSGLTDADREYYAGHSPVGRLVKVKYLTLSVDGLPQNATILAIL